MKSTFFIDMKGNLFNAEAIIFSTVFLHGQNIISVRFFSECIIEKTHRK